MGNEESKNTQSQREEVYKQEEPQSNFDFMNTES